MKEDVSNNRWYYQDFEHPDKDTVGARLTSAVKAKKIFDDTPSLCSSVSECVSLRSVVEGRRGQDAPELTLCYEQRHTVACYKCQDMYFHICSHWITYMVLKRGTCCTPWLQSKLLCDCESISLACRERWKSEEAERNCYTELIDPAPLFIICSLQQFLMRIWGFSAGTGVDQAEFRQVTERGARGGGCNFTCSDMHTIPAMDTPS